MGVKQFNSVSYWLGVANEFRHQGDSQLADRVIELLSRLNESTGEETASA